MRTVYIAGILIWLVVPVAGAVQQTRDSNRGQYSSASRSSSTIETIYAAGAGASRLTQTRTESNGREVIIETAETPGPDGKLQLSYETTTETVRTGSDSTQTRYEVFAPDGQGQRRLADTTQVEARISSDGSLRSVANTMVSDVNGRLEFSRREIQETKSLSPSVEQTDTSIYRPGINEPLVESARLQHSERKVTTDLTQSESTLSVRDGDGRWRAAETRTREVRTAGDENIAEETVHRPSDDGGLALSERKITRHSKRDGEDQTVTETYSHNAGGYSLSDPLQLTERVRVTTSATPDGGQYTIREVEGINPVATHEPLRIIERDIETLRQVGTDRWEAQRQVFALDVNSRLTLVLTERTESAGK